MYSVDRDSPILGELGDEIMPDNMPMPERRPTEVAPDPMGSPSPEGQAQPLLSPDDSRYNDPANVLFVDAIVGGMMPWIQAGVDLAAGRITEDQFDQVRQEHQERINLLKENNQTFVSAAEKAVPFLAGLGIGVAKPVSKVGTAVKMGAGFAGAQGFGQGFSSGPVEEPSFSGKRVGEGLGRAVQTAPLGMAGAAIPAGVKAGQGAMQRRADAKQAKQEADTAAAKKQASKDKAANTRRMKQLDAKFANEQADRFESYTKAPADASPHWKENRKLFMDQTGSQFADAATKGRTVTDLARATNLPEIVIAERIKAVKPFAESRAGTKLMNEVDRIMASQKAYKERLSTPEKPKKPRAKKAK